MTQLEIIQTIAVALISAIGGVAGAWFTFKGQLKQVKSSDRANENEFLLKLQQQISTEREQMNEQRLQDTRAIAENVTMISNMQKSLNALREEIAEWRAKYFDLNKKYNELQAEHLELQKKFSVLKGQITRMKNTTE